MKKKKPGQENSNVSEFAFTTPNSLQRTLTILENMRTRSWFAHEKRKVTITPTGDNAYRFQINKKVGRNIPIVVKGVITPETPDRMLITGKTRVALWIWPLMLLQGVIFISMSVFFLLNGAFFGLFFIVAFILSLAFSFYIAARQKKALVEMMQERLAATPITDNTGDYFE